MPLALAVYKMCYNEACLYLHAYEYTYFYSDNDDSFKQYTDPMIDAISRTRIYEAVRHYV